MVNGKTDRRVSLSNKKESTIEAVQYLLYALLEIISKLYLPVIKDNSLLQTRSKDIIDHFFELLNEQGHLQRSVIFYSDQLHLSPQYLSSLIKKETGKPIKQWISYMVIKHAKELLKTTSLSIKEISNRLQFVDSSLFADISDDAQGLQPIHTEKIIKSENSRKIYVL